jgi:L-aminopeptidase/D-esterase-like protein
MRRNLLTDAAGIAVGDAEDLHLGFGLTVILVDWPAIAAVSVLGGAPGGEATALDVPRAQQFWRERFDSSV